MDIVTENYNKISLVQLQNKLSQKLEQLHKTEAAEQLNESTKKDFIEQVQDGKNYDQEDFARVLEKFKRTDARIRSHEQIHGSIGHTTTPISYTYQQGPDGKMYAVGGSVRLDTSIPDDPKAAAFKLDQIQKAASAPIDSSGVDHQIARQTNLNKILLQLDEVTGES